ncbi:gamete expressed protein 1 [Prunus dulcis]|uniref:Gamete expressed protein 1 n=1 Tax=Prunus dulcis TaxID=3755 RepID=A0A4Y1R6D5_PRUDU|nr:gamete expressed protein 1 [Prunus dulcis]
MDHLRFLLALLIIISASSNCHSWGWFSSEETSSNENPSGSVGKFSMEGVNDQKGLLLAKCLSASLFWVLGDFAVEEKRSRFAWHLSDCFQKDSGRPPFPSCDPKSVMYKCLKSLNDYEHKVYLEFYLETNSICHQLQLSILISSMARVFKLETERLVNELKNSAQYAEGKLQVAQTAKNVEDHVDVVLKHSAAVYEQSRKSKLLNQSCKKDK